MIGQTSQRFVQTFNHRFSNFFPATANMASRMFVPSDSVVTASMPAGNDEIVLQIYETTEIQWPRLLRPRKRELLRRNTRWRFTPINEI